MTTAYLDHAASAPMRPEVAAAMAPLISDRFGHPSSGHRVGRESRAFLEEARDTVARLMGAEPREVVFTSGGTEADNLAVLGVLGAAGPCRVVTSAVEHPAVQEPARAAARQLDGVEHVTAPVDACGAVDLDRLADLLSERVALVSVMAANNEIGTVQPLDGVIALTRRLAPHAHVHTDAVQAAPWLDLAVVGADLVSISAHKLGGPKGAGALVVREGTPLRPLLYGGGQERERRGGTHDVAGAVGLATALEVSVAAREGEAARVRVLRDRLADGLLGLVPGTVESADRRRVLPGHCHLRFVGVDHEELLVLMDEGGVCASGGSACASGALEPSPVLAAMGVGGGGIRFSLGWSSTVADVEQALEVVPKAVATLCG